VSQHNLSIRWFTPDKPANISVGRQRISSHLRTVGYDVETVATTIESVRAAITEREQYEAIIGTTRAGAFAAVLVGKLTGKPIVVDHVDPIRQFRETHSVVTSIPVQIAENVCFTLSDYVMYVYEEEQERVVRYAQEAKSTSLGVDYDYFAEPARDVVESARDRLSRLPLRQNIAIYVGGLEPIYHITELMDAMGSLPEWSLIVIGEGTLRNKVERGASERENIHYLGTVRYEDVPGYVALADVGVSLVDDPHTLKVLEYGAAGLSVVQLDGRARNRFGDIVEYTEPDPRSIATTIEQAKNRENSTGIRSVAANHDWSQIASDYDDAIRRVL
jgi:glycosyltransferase involved in cell wall biosynthesis